VKADPRVRFTETVENYSRYRPGYPRALVDWVVEQAGVRPGARVLDVGCGTGITSRLFARRGLRVVGVDPNAAMIAQARRAGGGPGYVRGAAEGLPFADATLRAAISGQAFHWLDLDRGLPELARVLAPGGVCAAFWNERTDDTPFLREYERLLREHSAEYPVASSADTMRAIRAHPVAQGAHGGAEFASSQWLDREALIGRVWSASYVVHGVRDERAFRAALLASFDEHAQGGRVEFRYRSVALAFEPRA